MDGFAFAHQVLEDADLAQTRLVLLSSMTAEEASEGRHLAAFACSLTKPLRQSDLLRCLKRLDRGDRICAVTSDQFEADRALTVQHPTKVLVVEDNAVNQDLTKEMLVRLGCQVTLAEDGVEAVQAFEQGSFDLVFMDCQMPRMDGFEATRAMRDLERANRERARTPIVALTANAMDGDRDRCLAVGMDDYVAKPFKRDDLAQVFSRWLRDGITIPSDVSGFPAVDTTELAICADAGTSRAIDPAALRRIRQMAGPKGADLLVEIIGRYLDKAPDLLIDLADATENADYERVRHAAHSMKSSSANLGASQLSER